MNSEAKFQLDSTTDEEFLHTRIVKIVRYDVAESWQVLQWGSMGQFFTRCRI